MKTTDFIMAPFCIVSFILETNAYWVQRKNVVVPIRISYLDRYVMCNVCYWLWHVFSNGI